MTYKLNHILEVIKTPVILMIDGKGKRYSNGKELVEQTFEKNYLIESITARENTVVVTLKKNDMILDQTWIGEDSVSFM